MSMVDIHAEALEEINEAYHEFLLRYDALKLSVYGFVEGKDDPSFYRSVIERFLPSRWTVELFVSGNRRKVLDTEAAFDWTRFSRQQITFFIDRDLVQLLDPSINYAENVYVTDGYSIENSIVTREVFLRLLEEVHNIIDWTNAERDAVSLHFARQIETFQEAMAPLMAQIAIWRQSKAKANLNNLDLPSLITFCGGKWALQKGCDKPSARVQRLCDCVGADAASEADRDKMERIFREADGVKRLTRGKYLLWFLSMLANEVHANITVFVPSYNAPPKTRMTFGPKNVLVVAAPRARIPDSLEAFLERTYIQFVATREAVD